MFAKLIETLKANPRTLVFTEGSDARILEATDRLKKDGEASEDDGERAEKSLDATTKAHTELIDKMLAAKESELLTI